MGGKLGKRGLPTAEEKARDQNAVGASTEMEDPTGENVSHQGTETLQDERDAQGSQTPVVDGMVKYGDVKKIDSSITANLKSDQPRDMGAAVFGCEAPLVPESNSEVDDSKALVAILGEETK